MGFEKDSGQGVANFDTHLLKARNNSIAQITIAWGRVARSR